MKKRAFTLLEVLIALGLTLMTLSFLLGAYFFIERSNLEWQRREEELFAQRFVRRRLEQALITIPEIDQKETFFFTTDSAGIFLPGSPSLLFSYDNGFVFDNPYLSGDVLGRLYLDRKGNLILLTLPTRDIWQEGQFPSFHREVLMTGVKMLHFDFFQTATKEAPLDKEAPKPQWQLGAWSKDWAYRPGIIKVTITKPDNSQLIFHFLIPKVISVIKEAV